jgi:competence protein ComEC
MVATLFSRLFPLSALTAGAAFSYSGVYLFKTTHAGFPGFPLGIEWAVAAAAVLLWSVFLALGSPFVSRQRFFRHGVMLGLAFALGLLLGTGISRGVPPALSLGLPAERVSALEGILLEDPRALSGGNGMAALDLTRTWSDGVRSGARGKVTVIFPGGRLEDLKEFGRKSRVYLEGNFIAPQTGNKGNATGPGLFRAVGVHVVAPASPLERFRTGLRRNLVSRFSRPDNQSWGSLSLALLLGIRDNLDSHFSLAYRNAGVSHVLALSGMHLAVLSALIAFIFKPVLGPKGAAALGALFIIVYVFLVGSQPSLDRAAIMYLLGALAIACSFARNPASLLYLAFIVQIVRQPESGVSVSFILSYQALWGILHTGLEIAELFRGKIPPALLQPLSASLGAFIITASVSAAGFGILQPAGILAGLIIVPVTTLFMVLSIGYLILEQLLPILAQPLGMALSLIYTFLDRVVGFSARVPGIGIPAWLPVFVFSLALIGVVSFLAYRRRLAIAGIPVAHGNAC